MKLKILRANVIPACKQLLEVITISDIDISEVPIEEIMEEAFRSEPLEGQSN